MSQVVAGSVLESVSPATPPSTVADRFERAAIDRSTRLPVMLFFGTAIFWLLAGSLFGAIASLQMQLPEFLGNIPWMTFGRVRPAHFSCVIYGWAAPAGIGVAVWLMARLCRISLRHP